MHCPLYGIGIDLGATQIKMVCADEAGTIIERVTLPTNDNATAPWVDAIREQLNAWEQRHGSAGSVGLCAPGLATPDARAIGWMPGRMLGLEGLDWTDRLGRDLRVLNDGHAALLGELWQGAAQGARHAIMLTLGTGVGGAILSNDRLMRGAIGRAGHLGHMSLDPNGAPGIANCPGCLEDAIGNVTLPARSGGRFHDTAALLEAIQAGDAEAESIWLQSVRALGAGIVSLINIIDPECVVLGGGVADAGEALFAPLRDYLDQHEWRPGGHAVPIVPAQLGGLAGALGALYYARNFGDLH